MYLEEINLIDVELLGREHFERMERDRQHAESTGLAQLKRLQEHMLQTRLKYNKAKHEYYFPKEKGFKCVFMYLLFSGFFIIVRFVLFCALVPCI